MEPTRVHPRPCPADGVDLVDEEDAGAILPCQVATIVENAAHLERPDTDERAKQGVSLDTDTDERHPCFGCHNLRQVGLAASGRSEHQDTRLVFAAHRLKLRLAFEVVHPGTGFLRELWLPPVVVPR